MADIEHADTQRIDLWLWCARFRKLRADCARLVSGGAVRVNRRPIDKPGARVRVGDVLTVAIAGDTRGSTTIGAPSGAVRVVRILALATRRGPATEARTLYDEVPESAPSPCKAG